MKYEFNVIDNVLDVREMNDAEIAADKAHRLANVAEAKAEQAEAEAKAAARQVILDRLGLTADEANLLLG